MKLTHHNDRIRPAARGTLKIPFARRARRGAALMDNLLVVGLIVLAIIGILALYTTVQKSYQAAQLTIHMSQMVSGIQRAYASSATYDTTSLVGVLDGGGDIPSAARVVSSDGTVTIKTPYGDKIEVVGAGLTVAFTINNLPKSACERFLETFVGLGNQHTDLRSVQVDGTEMTIPLTRAAISTECSSTRSSNDVILTY